MGFVSQIHCQSSQEIWKRALAMLADGII